MSGLLNAGLFFLVTTVVVLIAVTLFNLVTRYKIWSEIQKGNLAVALSTGGFILGIANIMRASIESNINILDTLLWGGIGSIALIIVYFAFELLTPTINVSDEIAKGNKAVGLLSFVFSIAFSLVIGGCIS